MGQKCLSPVASAGGSSRTNVFLIYKNQCIVYNLILSLFLPGNEAGLSNLLASHWVPQVHTISNTRQIKFLRTPLFFPFFTSTGIASGSLRSANLVEFSAGERLRVADSSLRWRLAEERK